MHKCAPNPPLPAETTGLSSGLQESTEPVAYLFMCQDFAALQGSLAALHGFDEAIFLLEVTRYNFLHNVIEIDTLLRCSLAQAGLHVGRELDFHCPKIR
jgi:hypothetical protein